MFKRPPEFERIPRWVEPSEKKEPEAKPPEAVPEIVRELPPLPEQRVLPESLDERKRTLSALWDTLVSKPLEEIDKKIYRRLLKVGSYEKLKPEERERLKEIEEFSQEDYEKMVKGEIPWKLNAVWKALWEMRRGALKVEEIPKVEKIPIEVVKEAPPLKIENIKKEEFLKLTQRSMREAGVIDRRRREISQECEQIEKQKLLTPAIRERKKALEDEELKLKKQFEVMKEELPILELNEKVRSLERKLKNLERKIKEIKKSEERKKLESQADDLEREWRSAIARRDEAAKKLIEERTGRGELIPLRRPKIPALLEEIAKAA